MSNWSPSTSLPYRSRDLTRHELLKQDVYSFHSPKLDRLVRVVGAPRFVVALQLEFDPTVEAYTERPRTLRVGEDAYEFSYWHRHQGGREILTLVVLTPDVVSGSEGRQRHRKAEAIFGAAQAASLPLRFMFEADMTPHSVSLANYFRLLPSVQAAYQLEHRQALRQRVLEVIASRECIRLDQVISHLSAFAPADVSCGVADLLHGGEVITDWDVPLTQGTALRRTTS